jgi:hypothetical protein
MIRCEELAINLGKSSLAEPRRRKEISVMESNHTYMMGPKSHGMSGNIAFQARGDASKNHDYRAAALKAGGGKTGTNTREGRAKSKCQKGPRRIDEIKGLPHGCHPTAGESESPFRIIECPPRLGARLDPMVFDDASSRKNRTSEPGC